MSFKTAFNTDWTDEKLYPEFACWVECVESDPYRFRCKFCRKKYSLSNMGKQALTSHAKYDKHRKLLKNYNENKQNKFFGCDEMKKNINRTEIPKDTAVNNEVAKSDRPILKFVEKDSVLKAEIMWAIKLVISHSSLNSFKDAAEVFKLMFPDSEICQKVTLSSSKMAYLIAFGLSPFFYKELLHNIGKDVKFVLCMDEALNTIAQANQMDLIIRYWPESCSEVQVRFLNSIFLGHSTAQDLYNKFIEGSADLNLSNLLQIGLDGPNVNLKFLRTVMGEIKENKGHILIDIGTCSLHVIHNAFQRGNKISKWKLNEILVSIYRMFKDCPARRADFILCTESNVFPLKFCKVWWTENVKVAERALEVLPNVINYFNEFKPDLPHTFSIGNVENACNDKLIFCKISFFCSVASMLEPFLKSFQTAKPMVPFLYDFISDILRKIMLRFIRRDLLTDANTPSKLFDIKVQLKTNQLRVQNIDIGVGARSYLAKSKASEIEKTQFLKECKDFFIEMTSKIIQKFNVNFVVLRFLSCINPILMRRNAVLSEKRMESLLQVLHETDNLSALSADCAKQQFLSFIDRVKTDFKEQFSAFSEKEDRLDVFYHSLLFGKEEYKDVWSVVKIILTLSHGNATVESGFSINKDILVENLSENSLIGLRRTYDAILSKGGLASIALSSEMLQYAKLSRQRYHQYLEEKKKNQEKENKIVNQKRKIHDQIKLLQNKKANLSKDVTIQAQKIDEEISELKKNVSGENQGILRGFFFVK